VPDVDPNDTGEPGVGSPVGRSGDAFVGQT
jgi:hypothetical protein